MSKYIDIKTVGEYEVVYQGFIELFQLVNVLAEICSQHNTHFDEGVMSEMNRVIEEVILEGRAGMSVDMNGVGIVSRILLHTVRIQSFYD